MKPLLAFDTETYLIDQTHQLPPLVCLSMAWAGGCDLIACTTPDTLKAAATDIIRDRDHLKVNQAIAFDLAVFAANYPELLPEIYAALDDEQFSCIMIREQLLNLTTHGKLDMLQNPDGSSSPIKYNLATLEQKYLGLDRSAEKDAPDAWRTNYAALADVPLEQWPADAKQYPLDDAKNPLAIWQLQEERRCELIRERGIDPFKTEAFRVMIDFTLKLMGAVGVATDPAAVEKVEAMLARELAPDKLDLIVATGILVPAVPPRPKKGKDHVAGCNDPKNCNCPSKMTVPVEEKISKKTLEQYVLAFAHKLNDEVCPACKGAGHVPSTAMPKSFIGCETCKASGYVPRAGEPAVKLQYTDKSDKFPEGQLSVTSDWLNEYADMDPVLTQYKARQDLQKIVNTEIPRMKLDGVLQGVVYPQFAALKETGRTSSFAYKGTKDKPARSATFNCQNVDPRVRNCYVPRPGRLLWSCDYSQMELGTLAQTCYRLFGYSVLRDKINAGVDVHGYTGAQLAYALDETFQKLCIARFGSPSPQQISEEFFSLKKEPEGSEEFKFYKHWRKFAKPVNLGYPGGLGPKTFVKYAAGEAYGVHVTRDEAETLRDLWKQTYPEMIDYFAYINNQCIDPWNKGWDEEAQEHYALYAYDSPFGLHRAGCDYCACANGLGLQTPSADGALLGLINVVRACTTGYGSDILAPVQGRRVVEPLMFVHDEILGEIDDDSHVHERLMEVKRLMVEAMRIVTPDVKANANPCLMRRWDKRAEPTFKDGKLTVWTPPEN